MKNLQFLVDQFFIDRGIQGVAVGLEGDGEGNWVDIGERRQVYEWNDDLKLDFANLREGAKYLELLLKTWAGKVGFA